MSRFQGEQGRTEAAEEGGKMTKRAPQISPWSRECCLQDSGTPGAAGWTYQSCNSHRLLKRLQAVLQRRVLGKELHLALGRPDATPAQMPQPEPGSFPALSTRKNSSYLQCVSSLSTRHWDYRATPRPPFQTPSKIQNSSLDVEDL